jgi:hypothetical protein
MNEDTTEDTELRKLFTVLSDTSAAAAEALSNADAQRFYDLDTYVAATIKRIRAILLGSTETSLHVVRSNRPEAAVPAFADPKSRRASSAHLGDG